MTAPKPLTAEEVRSRLGAVDGWRGDTSEIEKFFEIEYHAGVRMVVDIAKDAKEHLHHPDIDVRWGRIRIGLTTHDAGHRVTMLDFESAQRIDQIAADHVAEPTL